MSVTPLSEHRGRLELALDASGPPLYRLTAIRNLRDHLGRMERDAVRDARAQLVSWAAIARALAVSRQAVHLRYRDLPVGESESAEDRWWRERREFEAQVVALFEARRSRAAADQAPMAW
jgi:hypothetical protein